MTTSGDYYVYAYRTAKNKHVRYIGYGKSIDRATSSNRNEKARKLLAKSSCTLEVAGPYRSKKTAVAVETALISFLRPDLNNKRAPGPKRYQFRPIGVPKKFCRRLARASLGKGDLTHKNRGNPCPLLFVLINKFRLGARQGYRLNDPPPDHKILARMEKWWQLGPHIRIWKRHPDRCPKILIGLTGPPAHRIIVGATRIDCHQLANGKPKGGLYKVATLGTKNLDACDLRGRLISPKAGIKFGSRRHQFFVILKRNGHTVGGQK